MFVSAALVLTGLVVTGVATTTAASASSSGMLSQVNAARANKGLPAFKWNAHLASVAGEQARRMARQTKLYHNPNLASDVGNFRRVGENVGYGPTSSSIQKAFMNSPGHRANILRNYKQIGIAQVRDAKGRLWVAQVFRTPSGSASSTATDAKKAKKKAAAKRAAAKKAAAKRVAAKKAAALRQDAAAKKAAAAKRAAAAQRAAAVQRAAAIERAAALERAAVAKERAAEAAAARATPTDATVTWAALSHVLGLASLVAMVTRGFATPVVPR